MKKTETIRKTIAQWIEPDVIAGLLIDALKDEDIPVTVDNVKGLWLACLDQSWPLLSDVARSRRV